MSPTSRALWKRVAVGVGVPLGGIAVVLVCVLLQKTPPCLFYELTGLYCVGCGTGRAMLAIFRGELYAAFRFQPLIMLLVPALGYYCLKEYVAYVFGRDVLPFPTVKSRALGIALLVLLVAYWVLRNVPVYPFTLLAPNAI